MQCRNTLHLLSSNDGRNLHESFYVIAGLEQRELACEEEQQDNTCCPNIDGFGEHQLVSVMVPQNGSTIPPVCSPHFSSTSGARNPRVPARLALDTGLQEALAT